MFQKIIDFPFVSKPNKPPSEVVSLVYQTSFSSKENKWKTGSGFKRVQNEFEKQMNSLPNWFKTKPSFSETNSA